MSDEPTTPDTTDAATKGADASLEEDAAQEEPTRRPGIAMTFIVVGTIIGFLAVFAIWVQRQALNTDNFTASSTRLLEDAAIRSAVSGFLVDQLYANVDVQ